MENFIIGVWAQPAFEYTGKNKNILQELMSKWAKRGILHHICNSIEPKTQSNSYEKYGKIINDNGMSFYMSTNDPVRVSSIPGFAGFCQPDEPDLWNHIPKDSSGKYDIKSAIDSYVNSYNNYKKYVPDARVFGNFSGPSLNSAVTDNKKNPVTQDVYKSWINNGLDIASGDFYLTNTNRDVEKYLRIGIGQLVRRLIAFSNKKQSVFCVEASNQKIDQNGREPLENEFFAQIIEALICGAKGIWYFPQEVGMLVKNPDGSLTKYGGNKPDAMSPAIIESMIFINKFMKDNANFFINGDRSYVQNGVFDITTWKIGSESLSIVLNTTGSSQTLNGKIYKPFEFSTDAHEVSNNASPGLTGSYFDNILLSGVPKVTRTDQCIDMLRKDFPFDDTITGFSVRWYGFISGKINGDHIINTYTDDGVRVWINGSKIIDKWGRFRGENSAIVKLERDKKYPIKIEYFQQWGDAMAKLSWQPRGMSKEVIPKEFLSN